MESGKISGSQLSASHENTDQPAPYGRPKGVGWRCGSNSPVWYQVDFRKHAKVTSIKTQGDSSYYVKIFKILYSSNGIDFPEYIDVLRSKVEKHYFNIFSLEF